MALRDGERARTGDDQKDLMSKTCVAGFNAVRRLVGLYMRLREPLLVVHLSFSAVSSWPF